ncbi:SDR family NAD(P)-dependent oxidoreductase [Kitasatospora aureofaciens]|uniref:3-oxoacyl-ACP reductase n=1 Tax=Kitasatospora aureofaciens TaxID=1894 RepID=A0A1E7N141_KITAU|nr:SDR family oxidoreductase [Kitasatospora aureofaciens]OEV34381.1 short-chain dehydrogenase [Kitasatospora aureofaciens]UKZ04440.1 SDR family oxidoreductase [Streptomyces viridifaciens]GGU85615.1 3-oxoacyl-ACP reductase [Kitasatospora aureofaciens]
MTRERLAVVSGGGTGIGRAIAARLAGDGYRVAVLGRRAAVLEEARARIERDAGPGAVVPVAGDLTDPAVVEQVAARVGELGPVDVLVNNAGAIITPPEDAGLAALAASWRRDLDTNLLTAVLLTTALQGALRRPGGRLVVISSAAAQRGGAGPHSAGSYAAAKAALHGWAFGLARQLGPDGITVNVLAPGYVVDTEIFGADWNEEFHARKVADTLVGRAGTPADVAEAVAYVASPAAGYLTGQVIGLNGGAVLGR